MDGLSQWDGTKYWGATVQLEVLWTVLIITFKSDPQMTLPVLSWHPLCLELPPQASMLMSFKSFLDTNLFHVTFGTTTLPPMEEENAVNQQHMHKKLQ